LNSPAIAGLFFQVRGLQQWSSIHLPLATKTQTNTSTLLPIKLFDARFCVCVADCCVVALFAGVSDVVDVDDVAGAAVVAEVDVAGFALLLAAVCVSSPEVVAPLLMALLALLNCVICACSAVICADSVCSAVVLLELLDDASSCFNSFSYFASNFSNVAICVAALVLLVLFVAVTLAVCPIAETMMTSHMKFPHLLDRLQTWQMKT
jgi:hypothetical protein